jgi:hypothetical protein
VLAHFLVPCLVCYIDSIFAALLGKTLAELHVTSGAYLQCDDFLQQFELRLVVVHNEQLQGDDFVVVSDEGNAGGGMAIGPLLLSGLL